MNSKTLTWAVCIIAVFTILAGHSVSAQGLDDHNTPFHYHGVINDYPVSANPTAGPWELRGPWSLRLQPRSGTADFSAALTMEYSDLAAGTGAATDSRHQHTHQITMKGATLIQNPPQTDCPTGITPFPTYTWLIELKGMADVSGNGGYVFGEGTLVPLQVCLGGGPNTPVSNLTLVFTNLSSGGPSPATNHFGGQPIHGVVREP